MKDNTAQDRQIAIRQSAWKAFADYGYRKTSMDDIARGAGISRPALYLHYKNKEDIFRTLARTYFDEASARFQAALARPGPVGEVLGDAILAKSGELISVILASPHGQEVLDIKVTNAADIVEAGETQLAGILAEWLEDQARAGRVVLSAPAMQVARICFGAVGGLMATAKSHDDFVTGIRTLGALLGDGLSPR